MPPWAPRLVILAILLVGVAIGALSVIRELRGLISNLIFMAPVSLLLRRWQPPFGSLTFLFTFIAAGLATQTEGSRGMLVGAALVGGLVGDMAIRRFNPTPTSIATTPDATRSVLNKLRRANVLGGKLRHASRFVRALTR